MSGNSSKTNRDEIRKAIFTAKPEKRIISFFGNDIELRQPNLGDAMAARTEDVREAGIQMLLNFAYVPGTEEKVFEEADEDGIRRLPMCKDLTNLFNVCAELLGADTEGLNRQIDEAAKSASGGSPAVHGDDDSAGAGEE